MMLSSYSPGAVILVVVALALAPFVAVMVTAYTKIVVVLSLLRNALGLQQVPPNVLNGLAIILSVYVMYPILLEMQENTQQAMEQFTAQHSDTDKLLSLAREAKEPLRAFYMRTRRTLSGSFL